MDVIFQLSGPINEAPK